MSGDQFGFLEGALGQRILAAAAHLPGGEGAVMLGCTTPESGGYGRITIDVFDGIEVRFFGWGNVFPGHADESPRAIGALLRNTFVFDGQDWVWRRSAALRELAVAAHLAVRTLHDVWEIVEGSSDCTLVDIYPIELPHDPELCIRCLDIDCRHSVDRP